MYNSNENKGVQTIFWQNLAFGKGGCLISIVTHLIKSDENVK